MDRKIGSVEDKYAGIEHSLVLRFVNIVTYKI
jgi:hypothetical protein